MKKDSMGVTAYFLRQTGALILIATLAACAANRPAPVSDARPAAAPRTSVPDDTQPALVTLPVARPIDVEKIHVIQKGDTLISVALQNGLDYRELAAWNNIENPNVIRLGETLRLTAPGTAIVAASGAQPKPGEPVASPLIVTPVPNTGANVGNTDKFKTEPKVTKVPYSDAAYAKLSTEPTPGSASGPPTGLTGGVVNTSPPNVGIPAAGVSAATTGSDDVEWAWPIQPQPKGKIIANFTDANKGIDIGGTKNAPVLAAAAGKVVYSGAGLRGYGRLVIIKHNNTWLSAYAHNEKILVMEGEGVKKGQKIAEMGNSDADQVKLHFEIRKQGKPVDPLKLLPN